MATFGNAVRIMFKRPFIILYFGLVMLVYYLIGRYNPLTGILYGFSSIGVGNPLDNIISFLQLVTSLAASWNVIVKAIAFSLGFLVLASLIIGLVFSGYFYILDKTAGEKPRAQGEYTKGLKNYFFKVTAISFMALLYTLLFLLFSMVVTVPAVVVTKTWQAGRPDLLLPSVILDAVTVLVLFFSFMFFRIYMFFWYPAVYNSSGKAFGEAKRAADKHFWSIVGRLMLSDVAFIIFQSLLIYTERFPVIQKPGFSVVAAILFLTNWVFKTFFFASLIAYVFTAYKKYSVQ